MPAAFLSNGITSGDVHGNIKINDGRSLCLSLLPHPAELSLNTSSFAKSAAMLGSAEDNTALSRALSQLAEVEDRMEQLHQDQAANDTFGFAEVIADYIRLLGAVRVLGRIRCPIIPDNPRLNAHS